MAKVVRHQGNLPQGHNHPGHHQSQGHLINPWWSVRYPQVLADEQKKLYPDCWKRKVKPSQAATSNSSQASPTFSGAIFARFNKKIKKTRDPHHPKAFSNDCTERGSKLKARKVAPGFIFRLSGAGQSPGLSPHPVFHPPSSPGSSFYPNELPNTKKSKYN